MSKSSLQKQGLLKEIENYEKELLRLKPPDSHVQLWKHTRSGIEEIIRYSQAPYLSQKYRLPLILIATPEIVYLPKNMGALADVITTGDGGGLADISAALVAELNRRGVNVQVTLPEYQNLFKDLARITKSEYETLRRSVRDSSRIHPITDDIFKMAQKVYDDRSAGIDNVNVRRSTAFMRGVISRLLPLLQEQNEHILVHCNDWMTGLIPPAAKSLGVQSLMTFHNVFTFHQAPSDLREHSIDIEPFWKNLIIDGEPGTAYKSYTRIFADDPPVDFMNSGLYAADMINTVSSTFLKEMVAGYFTEYNIMPELMRDIIRDRYVENDALGILNAPATAADPRRDRSLVQNYWHEPACRGKCADIKTGKLANRQDFQSMMGFPENSQGPIFYWPSRIVRPQKGFDLLIRCLPALMYNYQADNLKIAVVANGEQELIRLFQTYEAQYPTRIRYKPFSRGLSQIGLAGSDFVLMPSLYEPCGTPQVAGQLYGTPPVVRKTGGLTDTVKTLSFNGIDGSGFMFEEFNEDGLLFGFSEAMKFWRRDEPFRYQVLARIMKEASIKFNIKNTADQYIQVYQEIFKKSGASVTVL